MSYVEHPREITQQDKIDWDYSYTQTRGLDKWIPNPRDFVVKKCCDNCDYKLIYDKGNITMCKQYVSNSLNSDIVNSDTFYCSYHKLRLDNE